MMSGVAFNEKGERPKPRYAPPEVKKETLLERWKYSLGYWLPIFGSAPVELVKEHDRSEAYEMSAAELFRLENGKFALVIEEGCSCYDPSHAQIELFPTKEKALKQFAAWELRRG